MGIRLVWQQAREEWLWAWASLTAGLLVIGVTWGAGTPKLSPGDPGPWGLPMACAVLISLCAVAELVRVWLRANMGNGSSTTSPTHEMSEPPVEGSPVGFALAPDESTSAAKGESAVARLTLGDWLTIVAIGLYCLLIPVIGFTLSTLLLTPLLLNRFGANWSIFWSLLVGVGMVVAINLIFGSIFGVQMPDLF